MVVVGAQFGKGRREGKQRETEEKEDEEEEKRNSKRNSLSLFSSLLPVGSFVFFVFPQYIYLPICLTCLGAVLFESAYIYVHLRRCHLDMSSISSEGPAAGDGPCRAYVLSLITNVATFTPARDLTATTAGPCITTTTTTKQSHSRRLFM